MLYGTAVVDCVIGHKAIHPKVLPLKRRATQERNRDTRRASAAQNPYRRAGILTNCALDHTGRPVQPTRQRPRHCKVGFSVARLNPMGLRVIVIELYRTPAVTFNGNGWICQNYGRLDLTLGYRPIG